MLFLKYPNTMPRLLIPLLLILSSSVAQATDLQLSTQFSTSNRPFLEAAVTDLPTGPGQTRFGVSTHAIRASYRQSLSLPALGAVQGDAELSHPWSGGLRLRGQLGGSVGPVSLGIRGEAFNAPLSAEAPLAPWQEEAHDLRPQGWNVNLDARYRLSRFLTAHGHSELGAQANTLAELEWRRAPAADADPDNVLLLRGGVRAGQEVLGLSAGLTYRTGNGLDLSADALLGPQPSLSARLNLPPLGDTELSAYASYEPWRRFSAPLRYGADLSRPLGRGQLGVSLRGGQGLDGQPGFGAALQYSLPLGQQGDDTP